MHAKTSRAFLNEKLILSSSLNYLLLPGYPRVLLMIGHLSSLPSFDKQIK